MVVRVTICPVPELPSSTKGALTLISSSVMHPLYSLCMVLLIPFSWLLKAEIPCDELWTLEHQQIQQLCHPNRKHYFFWGPSAFKKCSNSWSSNAMVVNYGMMHWTAMLDVQMTEGAGPFWLSSQGIHFTEKPLNFTLRLIFKCSYIMLVPIILQKLKPIPNPSSAWLR